MSSSNQITPILSKSFFEHNPKSQTQTYNELINYGSIRKQFSRIIPFYMNYQNKKFNINRNYSSNIEEFHKLKEEIISMKSSIAFLKERKQKKLEQIEELRCLMRKVGHKQAYYNNSNHITNYHQRETNGHKTNNQYFRGTNKNIDKKQRCDNIRSSSDEVEGGLSLMPSTSGMSSGKDDEAAPEGGYEGDKQGDFICENSSDNYLWNNSNNNNDRNSRCCFDVKEEKEGKLHDLQEKDSCFLLGKEN